MEVDESRARRKRSQMLGWRLCTGAARPTRWALGMTRRNRQWYRKARAARGEPEIYRACGVVMVVDEVWSVVSRSELSVGNVGRSYCDCLAPLTGGLMVSRSVLMVCWGVR